LSDPRETIIITITAPGGYTISGPDTATATILDNDGDAANNRLVGTSLADALAGGGGNDTIDGDLGNDTLDGGVGVDSMDGGDGNDTYFVDNVSDIVKEIYDDAIGGTADTVFASVNYSLAPGTSDNQGYGIENLNLTGSGDINATGNSKNNVLTGNSGSNVLNGGDGNDTLDGGAGNDNLTGGLGKDILTGSTGLDTLNYNSLGESLLSGFDVIQGYSGTGASLDRINAPAPIAPITLTASKGTATALTEAAIQLVLTNAAFAANTAAAFKVTGQSGTFIALNNGAAGFQAASDAIIQLSSYNIAVATPVLVI